MFRFAAILIAMACALATAGDSAKNTPKPDIIVLARLVEIPGKLPGNDLYNYVYVFKYRIVKVELGKISEQEIYVGQYNPLQARSQVKDKMDSLVNGNLATFKAGDVHRLQLVHPLEKVWKDAVEDEYFDNDAERWFAVSTDKAK
jgi:hypothetical protein